MIIFTLPAACNVLRESLLNINLFLEAFCIFNIPDALSVLKRSVAISKCLYVEGHLN